MTSDEGLNAYGAVTWGQIFIYQGFNEHVGWMHTSSGVDAEDEYPRDRHQEGGRLHLQARRQGAACRVDQDHGAVQDRVGYGDQGFHGLLHAARTGRARIERQVGRRRADAGAGEGAHAVVHAHQGDATTSRTDSRSSCTPTRRTTRSSPMRRRRHRVLPRQLHPEARPEVRLDASRSTAATRPRSTRACSRWTKRRTCSTRRAAGSTTATTGRGPPRGRRSPKQSDFPAYVETGRSEKPRGSTRSGCCRVSKDLRWTTCSRRWRSTATCRRSRS